MKLHHGRRVTPFGIREKHHTDLSVINTHWLLAAEAKEFYYNYENPYN